MFHCAECDPTTVYSSMRTEDIDYGQIIIRPNRHRGTAALYSVKTKQGYFLRFWTVLLFSKTHESVKHDEAQPSCSQRHFESL